MLCKLWIQHFETGREGNSYLEPITFSDLDDLINGLDYVKVMKPNELDMFAEEDWFGDSPYWEEYMEDVKKCTSLITYGEYGGFKFNTITQFNFKE